MEKVTLALTYYNSRDHFEKNKFFYENCDMTGIEVIVVDDGSQVDPLTPEDMPKGWKLYTITKDVGWNNEGAKNLLMHVTETRWTLLMDIDYILMPHAVENLKRLPAQGDPNKGYFTLRHINIESNGLIKPFYKMSPNCYAITKEHFWKLGGYDETLQGLYGYDGTMVKQLTPVRGDAWSRHQFGLDCIHLGGGGSSWTREEKDVSKVQCKIAGASRPKQAERLKFPWERRV